MNKLQIVVNDTILTLYFIYQLCKVEEMNEDTG